MTTDLKKLAEVRRYTYWCRFSHGHNPAEDKNGEFVRYSDYTTLAQEVETLRADREEARTTFNRLLDELRDLKTRLARHEEAAPQDLARLYDEGYHGLDGDPSISEDSRHRHALKYVVAMSTPQDGETKP